MGLRTPRARVVLPVCGALVVGVGIGSAIGWMAGGSSPAGQTTAAAATSLATTSFLSASPRRSQNDEAVALLQRAMVARSSIPWHGTQIVTTWAASVKTSWIVDLSHQPGQGTTALVHASEPGVQDVTYVPDSDGPQNSSDTDGSGPVGLLSRTYTLKVVSGQPVAGYSTTEVDAIRTDGSVAARLWIDQDTGLLLRRELVDSGGHLTQSTAFVDFVPGEVQSVSAGQNVTSPWTAEVGADELAALRKAGWACPQQLAEGMTLYDVRRTPSGSPQIVHLAYSDGLVNVSVFEERGHLDTGALSGYTTTKVDGHAVYVRRSAAGTGDEMTWQAHGIVFTVVTDAPSSAVVAVVAGLPGRPTATGGWSRVRRGVDRMGSWVDPTG